MEISQEKCMTCGECIAYCPVYAIDYNEEKVEINLDMCVECGACLRADICPVDAIEESDLSWPRILRAAFSNPFVRHESTEQMGRGTEEIKTNDVTNLIKHGEAAVMVEGGRPGVGAYFRDIEKVTMALTECGVKFAPNTPVTSLIKDINSGKLVEDIADEKVLSAIVECKVDEERIPLILKRLEKINVEKLDTVFTVSFAFKADKEGNISLPQGAAEFSQFFCNKGKVNLGFGRKA